MAMECESSVTGILLSSLHPLVFRVAMLCVYATVTRLGERVSIRSIAMPCHLAQVK